MQLHFRLKEIYSNLYFALNNIYLILCGSRYQRFIACS